MNDFFERLAAQSALKVGAGTRHFPVPREIPEEIEVVDLVAQPEAPQPPESLPVAPSPGLKPVVESRNEERQAETPKVEDGMDHDSGAHPRPAPAVRPEEVTFTPSEIPKTDPESPLESQEEAAPVHATLQAVFRWISRGEAEPVEPHGAPSMDSLPVGMGTPGATGPGAAPSAPVQPEAVPEPVADGNRPDGLQAEDPGVDRPDLTPRPQTVNPAAPRPMAVTARRPAAPDRRHNRADRPPTVTIGSIHVTVDSNRPEPAPPSSAAPLRSAATPPEPVERANSRVLRRHYIVPH